VSPDEVVLPVCGFQAFPRQSRTGLRHFVHRTGTGCADHPGETPGTWRPRRSSSRRPCRPGGTRSRNSRARPRPGEQGPGWVADVLATSGRRRVALEVQWSRQSLQRYRERQKAYQDSDMRAIWLHSSRRIAPASRRRAPGVPAQPARGPRQGPGPQPLGGPIGDGARDGPGESGREAVPSRCGSTSISCRSTRW